MRIPPAMPLLIPLVLSLLYLCVFFPNAHFRHDDWMMLRNYLTLDWDKLFSGNIIYSDRPEPWFFRPLVGINTHLLTKAFHLNSYAYFVSFLLFTLGAVFFGYRAIFDLTRSRSQATLFVALFFGSFHLHFGSINWVGEGVMNCPQLFFLSLSLYGFAKAITTERSYFAYHCLAFFTYAVSLGFKESSLFLPGLFAALLFHRRQLRNWMELVPYGILAVGYAYFRFFHIPMNPGYLPKKELQTYVQPILMFGGALFCTWLAVATSLWIQSPQFLFRHMKNLGKALPFLPFLLLLLAPHFGHGFFSPGWFLVPGFFFSLVLGLICQWEGSAKHLLPVTGFALLFSLTPLLLNLERMGWWHWKKSETEFINLVSTLPTTTATLKIVDCPNPNYPKGTLSRVIGDKDHVHHMVKMLQKRDISIGVLSCEDEVKDEENTVYLRWEFPEVQRITPPKV